MLTICLYKGSLELKNTRQRACSGQLHCTTKRSLLL